MKCSRIFSMIMTLLIFGFLAATSAQATNWTVTQLTNNSYRDLKPNIYGSNVAWAGQIGGSDSDYEIFLYDANSTVTTQLTNNSYNDSYLHIYGSSVAWEGYGPDGSDSEIFLYDGSATPPISNSPSVVGSGMAADPPTRLVR